MLFVLLLSAASLFAETKTMTLREALDLALAQNPDLLLTRLDQQKAREQVTIARDPFVPKVYAGSGAAWTSGFPASIEGEPPAIVEFKTQMSLYNQPQRYQIAAARENARGAEIDVAKQQEEVAYRVAALYLDAEKAAHELQAAQLELENLTRVAEMVKTRVDEGREIPHAAMAANVDRARVKRIADSLSLDLRQAESSLAVVLGMKPDDRVRASQDHAPFLMPESEQDSIDRLLESSPELKRLESQIQAKELEIKGYRAERLPKVDIVAQDQIYARYQEEFFTKFQRNGAQLGASFTIPLLAGNSSKAYIAQAEADIAKLRIQADHTRAQLANDARRAFQEVKRAEEGRDFARQDLEAARDQVSVNLALQDEGKLLPAEVEKARAEEQTKWMAYYDAQHNEELARLNVLRYTGVLLASVK